MNRRLVWIGCCVLLALAGFTAAKAQRQSGQVVRLRTLKVTQEGVQPRTVQGEPEVVGFSCTTGLSDTEPTCYVLLRDRIF